MSLTRPLAIALAALAAALLLWPSGGGLAAAAAAGEVAPGRVVVKYRGGLGAVTVRTAQASVGALAIEQRPAIGAQLWRVAPGSEAEVAARLSARWDVEYAEPDRVVHASASASDPLYASYQWDMREIGLESAWDVTTGDPSVTVAVIDTGIDPTHPDAPAHLALGCDYVAWTGGGACPRVAADENGHGTHVAGIVAARQNNGIGISGVAPGASVLAIRVLDADGSGYDSDIAAAIREATDAGARVINLSLGGPDPTQTSRGAVDYALQHGVVVVAAAGNEYQSGSPTSYPAAYPGVVAVAATTSDDGHAPYSNTGSYVSISAPGGDGGGRAASHWITSLYPVSKGSYVMMVGTSQASPHVAGVAALVRSLRPDMAGASVATLLTSTARPLGGSVPNQTFGAGLVDAAAAVAAARGVAAPTSTATPTATATRTSTATPTPTSTPTAVPASPSASPDVPAGITPAPAAQPPTATPPAVSFRTLIPLGFR